MNAATVTDLDSHKVEFVAETHFEQGIHSVSIGLDTGQFCLCSLSNLYSNVAISVVKLNTQAIISN